MYIEDQDREVYEKTSTQGVEVGIKALGEMI